MATKRIFLITGIILIICLFPCTMAELTGERVSQVLSAKGVSVPVVCDQPYALCDTAYCVPA